MGSGHVMRYLTLAEKLKSNGTDITFFSRVHEGNLIELISKIEIEVVELQEPETFENVSTKTFAWTPTRIIMGVSLHWRKDCRHFLIISSKH